MKRYCYVCGKKTEGGMFCSPLCYFRIEKAIEKDNEGDD